MEKKDIAIVASLARRHFSLFMIFMLWRNLFLLRKERKLGGKNVGILLGMHGDCGWVFFFCR